MKTSGRLNIRNIVIAGLLLAGVAVGGATVARLSASRSDRESPAEAASLPVVLPYLSVSTPVPESVFSEITLDEPLLSPQELDIVPSSPVDVDIEANPTYIPNGVDTAGFDVAPFRTANRIAWPNAVGGSGMAVASSDMPKRNAPYKGGIGDHRKRGAHHEPPFRPLRANGTLNLMFLHPTFGAE